MPRDHFAAMYRNPSHRHDTPHDSYNFDKAVGTLTGMLYSIVTLKAFFPFFRSPEKITDNTVNHAPYPMPPQIAGDQEEQNKPL
jgi:hypothetical protein